MPCTAGCNSVKIIESSVSNDLYLILHIVHTE